MKLISFNYTDLKGNVTTRQALVVQEATDKHAAIDVSEADDSTIVEFAQAYETARQAFLSQVTALEKQYDLRYRFRQFFPEKMDVISTDSIA